MAKPRSNARSKPKTRARAPLTRELALRTAMSLADRDGLDALSMRRLAEELRVEAMSLYHHVANKEAILDGMVDLVFAEIEMPRIDLEWKEAMRSRMTSVREVLLRHRWALRVLESRKNPGPFTLAHHDAVLGCLRRGGLSVRLAAHAFAVLDAYVFGFVHTELTLPFQGEQETQEVAAAIFDQIPAGALPHLVELTRELVLQPGYSFANEFPFGLALIIDGLERASAAEQT